MTTYQPCFLVASSIMAYEPAPFTFSLTKTIEYAAGKVDGVQLYINPQKFLDEIEDIDIIKRLLKKSELKTNIAHLPGYMIPSDLKGEGAFALKIASKILDPIPLIGKICIIHHLPYSSIPTQKIINSAREVINNIGDPTLVIGLENFHPKDRTNQITLSDQIDEYIDLVLSMQNEIPVIPVIDLARFYTINANNNGIPLEDSDFQLLRRLCSSFKSQRIILHAVDWINPFKNPVEPGNAVKIGDDNGYMTQIYKNMMPILKEYDVKLYLIVDETEDKVAMSLKNDIVNIFK